MKSPCAASPANGDGITGTLLGMKATMTASDRRLLRHLAFAVAVKLAVLAGLWLLFVRDSGVPAGSEEVADHIAGVRPGPGAPP